MTLNQNSNSIAPSFPLLLEKLKHIFLHNLWLFVSLPPAVTDSQESRVFLHFERLLCHIIGAFLGALALKVCSLLSVLMRKWAVLPRYVPQPQWKFNVPSVNNTQQSPICTSIVMRSLYLCTRALFIFCSLESKMLFESLLFYLLYCVSYQMNIKTRYLLTCLYVNGKAVVFF